jgi:type III secretion protein L
VPANVLKQRAPLLSSRLPRAVVDAAERARAIVADAEEASARIREGVEAERERALAGAEEAGYEAGRARAAELLATAAAERDRLLGAVARDVAALAIDVARRLLGRELAADPGAVVDLAARAVRGVRERAVVTLRVSPSDAPRVRAAEGRLAALLLRAPGVAVREDAALSAGDVVVETEAGRVDARVPAQLAALERALAEVRP